MKVDVIYEKHFKQWDRISVANSMSSGFLIREMVAYFFSLMCSLIQNVFLIWSTGVFTQHSVVGLETRRRRDLLGGVETWFHRTKLSSTRILYNDGKFVRHEVVQNGESF